MVKDKDSHFVYESHLRNGSILLGLYDNNGDLITTFGDRDTTDTLDISLNEGGKYTVKARAKGANGGFTLRIVNVGIHDLRNKSHVGEQQ